MKKYLLALLSLFLTMGGVKAEDVTLDLSKTGFLAAALGNPTENTPLKDGDVYTESVSGVKLTVNKGSGTIPAYNSKDGLRVYKNSNFTLTAPEGKVITQFVANCYDSSSVLKGSSDPTGTITVSGSASTWSGNPSQNVKIMPTATAKIESLVITLDDASVLAETSMTFSQSEYALSKSEAFTAPTLSFTTEGKDMPAEELANVDYTSSNVNVAAIENGQVVLKGGLGEATITATYNGSQLYKSCTACYTIKVYDLNVYTFISTELGVSDGTSVVGTYALKNFNSDSKVSVTFAKGTGSNPLYKNDPSVRIYKGNSFTISCEQGYVIEAIGFVFENANSSMSNPTVDCGTYANNTWTGSASNVTFTDATSHIQEINVTIAETSLKQPVMEFSQDVVELTIGGTFTAPTLTVDGQSVPSQYNDCISFSSDNPTLASVDNDGNVTLGSNEFGIATITASIAGSNKYFDTKKSYTIKVNKPVTVTFTAPVATGGWGTLILPFAVSKDDLDGLEVYYGLNLATDNTTLTMTKSTTGMRIDCPYLVKGEPGKTYTFNGVVYEDTKTGWFKNGKMSGTFEETMATTGDYVLQVHDGVMGFYRVGDTDVTVGANRCVLRGLTISSEVKAIFLDGDFTGISAVAAQSEMVDVYNVNGVLVRKNVKASEALNNLAPGIYVVNGEKHFVK